MLFLLRNCTKSSISLVKLLNAQKQFQNIPKQFSISLSFSTAPTPDYSNTNEEWAKKEANELLRKIVDQYSKKKRTFVLPWADQEAINSMVFPFERLLYQGVAPDFLFELCMRKENLFRKITKNGTQTYEILLVFVENFSMSFEDASRFFARWSDELTGESAHSIQKRMSVLLGRGILAGPQLRKIVEKCPALLFTTDAQKMDSCLERIFSYFQLGHLRMLMQNCPHICLLNEDELEEKYEYIYYHMGIECTELVESQHWMDLDIGQIIARHQFLVKLGKYMFPDPKKPQYKKGNPKAEQIFNSDEQRFAEEIGQVTNEEWLIFQELWEREKRMEEQERPYERIKMSQRKAFERKLKKARTGEEGEISDGILNG